jgi:hypothetical protein
MHLNFQAVIKQFSGTGFERSDSVVIDEVELQQHQRLEKLYSSTRSGRVRKGKLHRHIMYGRKPKFKIAITYLLSFQGYAERATILNLHSVH